MSEEKGSSRAAGETVRTSGGSTVRLVMLIYFLSGACSLML
jgi:hypothetical protein